VVVRVFDKYTTKARITMSKDSEKEDDIFSRITDHIEGMGNEMIERDFTQLVEDFAKMVKDYRFIVQFSKCSKCEKVRGYEVSDMPPEKQQDIKVCSTSVATAWVLKRFLGVIFGAVHLPTQEIDYRIVEIIEDAKNRLGEILSETVGGCGR
jgi:hypothetical protein